MTAKELPVSVGARLLDINRTSIYYKGLPISEDELACKEIIDHLHTDNPTWGARQMSAQLKARGYQVGRRKARRYMDESPNVIQCPLDCLTTTIVQMDLMKRNIQSP